MSKPLIFEPRDFAGSTELIDHISWEDAAITANKLFSQWLEAQQVVYGSSDGSLHTEMHFPWFGESSIQDTHKARLVCIEALAPKECKHEPLDTGKAIDLRENECRHCGVKLKATWFVDE